MPNPQIPDGTIRRILEDEPAPIRFEDFCSDLLTEVDGIDYVGTSRSWDLARDGRSLPITAEGQCGYICCTTGKELGEKPRSDLTRMVQHACPAAIYFCTTQLCSEDHLEAIEKTIRSIAPDVDKITVLGAYQLVPLIQRHPTPFQRRYAAELLEHADFLSQTSCDPQHDEVLGMQVALATQFDDNAQILRTQLIRRLVLRALTDGTSRTVGAIAKAVSDSLRLPRIIHPEYFREALTELVGVGLIMETTGIFTISEAGHEAVADDQTAANSGVIRGKTAVRTAIEQLLETPIDEASFEQLWTHLLDEFANIFFAQGLKIIQAISSLTHDASPSTPRQTFGELLDGMRRRITQLGVGGARSHAVAQAVVDLFSERDSEAFSWLTEIAVKYVNLCSLGLEPTAQQQVSSRLKDLNLVLDTDIVLSYLSEGERPHKAIQETLNRWRDIGGKVIVVPPVLEEATYHAWISEFEYKEVWRQLASFAPEEMPRYVKNAFVRAFFFAAKGRFEPTRWGYFISEYRGHDSTDTTKMHDILQDGGFTVEDDLQIDSGFADEVRKRIYEIRGIAEGTHIRKQVADKVNRDGQIVGYLHASRSQKPSPHHTTVIVSSSPILQKAASGFSQQLGEPSPVWPIGALAYLVSLIPGVRLTLGVLRNCLFEEGQFDMMDRVTQFALRVIRQSDEYSIGYSQRTTLKKALGQQISKGAVQRGQRPSEFVDDLMDAAPENREGFAEVIAEAVDTFQASKTEKEVENLRQTIRDMSGT